MSVFAAQLNIALRPPLPLMKLNNSWYVLCNFEATGCTTLYMAGGSG